MPENRQDNGNPVSTDNYDEALDWLKAEQLKRSFRNTKMDETAPDQSKTDVAEEIPESNHQIQEQSPSVTHFSLRSGKAGMFIVGFFLILCLIVGIKYFNQPIDNAIIDDTGSDDTIIENTDSDISEDNKMPEEYASVWSANKAINEDYIGQLVFDSGLIDLPFVQARDVYDRNGKLYKFYDEQGHLVTVPTGYTGNDVYIWTNWKTGKYDYSDEGGSVFMDYRNDLNDQNLIIYGHHYARDWDPEGSKQFTPLDLLLKEENYQDNKTLKLYLENEIRSYVVTNVFIIDIYNEKQLQILRNNMSVDFYKKADPDFFESYIPYVTFISKYDTQEPLNKDDRLLTLVTCIQHQPQYRQIILCRQTDVQIFETATDPQ